MNKATEAGLAAEIVAAIKAAAFFNVTIFHGGRYHSEQRPTLARALAECPELESRHKSHRQAMVYAVSPGNQSVMIPRPFARTYLDARGEA